MNPDALNSSLERVLEQYRQSFADKAFIEEASEEDDLMRVFGLTQDIKAENRQYWGRDLGMCWQRLVTEICRQACSNFASPIRDGRDEFCDLVVGQDAIDTKYRVGSGDSGTLKKFKNYGERLSALGYRPVLLVLRNDNLPQALRSFINGGWVIEEGNNAYQYLDHLTQFDLQAWLQLKSCTIVIKHMVGSA